MKRVAVIGAGFWGRNLVRVFDELGSLAAVCDSAPGAETRVRTASPAVPFYPDVDRMLGDESISGCAIATPAVTHHALARAALLAGKDVFVEKPITLSPAEASDLIELAAARSRILMVGHILRYHPAIHALHALVRGGALGKIQYLYSHRLNIGRIRTEENILWSFAPHDISVILALLGEMPTTAWCQGGAYVNREVTDVTVSQFSFPSGVRAHVFVSWLHPFKEQRLVIVGSEKMAVFDDTARDKLVLYPHRIAWQDRLPTALKAAAEPVPIDQTEPLKLECQHFLDCMDSRSAPLTDGHEGLRVLQCLAGCQQSLHEGGGAVRIGVAAGALTPHFAHPTACVDEGAVVGAHTKIWHFSHVMKGARIGERCVLGQNVNVDGGVSIGNNVKIQNNVSVYSGVTLEDDVFLGPSCVLTNVTNPRSQVNRHSLYERTVLRRGATIGANATILCGITIGRYAFVAAGSVVTRNVPDYALVIGNPARQVGWMSRHGHRLPPPDAAGVMRCPESSLRYQLKGDDTLHCLDLDEDAPLPSELAVGTRSHAEFKLEGREAKTVRALP